MSDTPVAASVPKWHEWLDPVVRVMGSGESVPLQEIYRRAAERVGLSTEAQALRTSSGAQPVFWNRIGWAVTHAKIAGMLEQPERAHYRLTAEGEKRREDRSAIGAATLREYPSYREYYATMRNRSSESPGAAPARSSSVSEETVEQATPTELIDAGLAEIEANVAATLLANLQERHPDFFEQAVVDVLVAMGYGGTEGSGTRLGGSGDGGVDGVIDQDALGLSRIYVQAKRYGPGNSVQRPEVQGFVGALTGRGASQGVFVTTSTFSAGAREYIDRVPSRVVLIDGRRLAELMIHYRVGVHVKKTYHLVEVDEDYFE